MILAMSPAASWAVLLTAISVPVIAVGAAWRRDVRRQHQLDQRIARRYRQP